MVTVSIWIFSITTLIALVSQLYGIFVPLKFSKTKILRLFLLLIWVAALMASVLGFLMFNYCELERCAETLTVIGGSLVIATAIFNAIMAWYGFFKQQSSTID